MQIKELAKVAEILVRNGLGDEFIGADHDVIYLGVREEHPSFEEELEEAGAHYSEEFDGWICFC